MADWYRHEDERRTRGSDGGDDQGYRPQGRSSGRDNALREGRGNGEESNVRESRERGFGRPWASTYRPTTFTYTEIWAIPGPYAGQGPRGYQRSDDRIKEDVCERLTQHGNVDARNIEVTVSNGEVTLRGTVEDREMKRCAEDAAESVSGVQDVRNELRATPQQNSQSDRQNSPRPGEKKSDSEMRETSRQERNRVPS